MRQIVLLRGVNFGPRRRISMKDLRGALIGVGFEDVATYLQSGNVVLSSALPEEGLAHACEELIAATFEMDVKVLVRSHEELAAIVARNPLGELAGEPRRYQVSFFAAAPSAELVQSLEAFAAPSERIVAHGRELYAWHPEGVARSRLWARLAGAGLGIAATARNWRTVTSLLELAEA